MDVDAAVLGRWELLKTLGSGGFGQVCLWCDRSTGQKIAIKKLLEVTLKDMSVKGKLIERWCNEVEIMKKLNHTNIVTTLKVPPEISSAEPFPLLAMEYCSNGDLRQVLRKAENCCGLQESEILNILRDISNGLAYLHSCKIIHRDIKPDNIVLQENNAKIIYKLIDLGYAKALDQSSLSKSFVGTVQYIAPELFMGKEYTSSVDYWSFGLTTHEIITGHRPFLPGSTPSEWMKKIQNKSRNIVCVLESSDGEIVFHEKITRKNHSSRCFLEEIEKWLRLALDWDGQTRGRDTETNRLVIFENLTEIICKKLINVFSLPTYEILSYEIKDRTDIVDLRQWLKESTDIQENHQLLLLPSGKSLNASGNLLRSLEFEKLDRSMMALFLFDYSNPTFIKTDSISSPNSSAGIRNFSNRTWTYRRLKRYYADSVYFLQSQATLYRCFLHGIKIKISNTRQKTLAVESLHEDLVSEWNQIENYGHFLSLSHKTDLENYIYYRRAGKLRSSSFARKWIQNAIHVNNKIAELRSAFNRTKLRQLVLLAKQRCRTLDDNSNSDHTQPTFLDSLTERALKLWDNLQILSKNDNEISVSNGSILELVSKAEMETNNFLKSEMLKTLFSKIWDADENLAKFFSHLTSIYNSMTLLKSLIENTQRERQKEVWSLIEKVKDECYEQISSSESGDLEAPMYENEICSSSASKNVVFKESGSLRSNESESDRVASFNSSFTFGPPRKILPWPNLPDTYTVIEDNNHLRYRIQEAQETCNQTMKEIASLNWTFVQESKNDT